MPVAAEVEAEAPPPPDRVPHLQQQLPPPQVLAAGAARAPGDGAPPVRKRRRRDEEIVAAITSGDADYVVSATGAQVADVSAHDGHAWDMHAAGAVGSGGGGSRAGRGGGVSRLHKSKHQITQLAVDAANLAKAREGQGRAKPARGGRKYGF